jgi:hypothetical protein
MGFGKLECELDIAYAFLAAGYFYAEVMCPDGSPVFERGRAARRTMRRELGLVFNDSKLSALVGQCCHRENELFDGQIRERLAKCLSDLVTDVRNQTLVELSQKNEAGISRKHISRAIVHWMMMREGVETAPIRGKTGRPPRLDQAGRDALREHYLELRPRYKGAKRIHDNERRQYFRRNRAKSPSNEDWFAEWRNLSVGKFPDLFPDLIETLASNQPSYSGSDLAILHLAKKYHHGPEYLKQLVKGKRKSPVKH